MNHQEKTLQLWWDHRVETLRQCGLLRDDQTVELEISDDATLRDRHRHYAATEVRTLKVMLHRDALLLPPKQLLAVLLHELGHVVEHAGTPTGQLLVRYHDAPEDEEARADWIAGEIFWVTILYDPKNRVQTLDLGLPRPVGLK